MTKEIRIGLLAVVVIAVLFWGYKFLMGKNLFDNTKSYFVRYEHVDQLTASSPVLVNGYKVGSVSKIMLNPNDVNELKVFINIDGDINLPRNTKAVLFSVGIVGGKGIILDFNESCHDDCIPDEGEIKGEIRGLISSMVAENEVDLYIEKLQSGIGGVLDSIGSGSSGEVSLSDQLASIVTSLSSITEKLDRVITKNEESVTSIFNEINAVTSNLKANEDHISNVLSNLDSFTDQLKNVGLKETFEDVEKSLNSLADASDDIRSIASKTDKVVEDIDAILSDMNNGQGTMGKLLKDESMYNYMNETLTHLKLLMQDIRLNPNRYINISLINRNKEYTPTESDPALIPEE